MGISQRTPAPQGNGAARTAVRRSSTDLGRNALGAAVTCALVGATLARPARAWVFPEHADITAEALAPLVVPGSRHAALLEEIRTALALCEKEHDAQGHALCPTLATLPALAGDHSCTPWELRRSLGTASSEGGWIRAVLRVASETREHLRDAGADSLARADVRRQMHVDMQSADGRYLERALVDYNHFQLAREAGSRGDLGAYLAVALAPTVQANATAAYANFHVVAVRLAAAVPGETDPSRRRDWLVRAFLAEAFAVHFLEDSFSSGHFVGHWGDAATRLGTHDFYSGAGVEASHWNAPTATYVAHGDAFLSDGEARSAAAAVRDSVTQVLDAALDPECARALVGELRGAFGEEHYDACKSELAPPALASLQASDAITSIVRQEPVPASRYPALQRFRAEKGLFVGGAATIAAGYTPAAGASTEDAALRATFRVGFGAASIVDDPLNSQAFLDVGVTGEFVTQAGEPASVTGFVARLRAPGSVFLLDGMVAILLAQSLEAKCPFCLGWGSNAAGGGLGKIWKSHPLFDSTSWQISALRDVSVIWFHNEPRAGRYRTELLAPVLTARSALPVAGDGLSQSTDFYLDVGPSLVFTSEHPRAALGAFLSFTTATRLFP